MSLAYSEEAILFKVLSQTGIDCRLRMGLRDRPGFTRRDRRSRRRFDKMFSRSYGARVADGSGVVHLLQLITTHGYIRVGSELLFQQCQRVQRDVFITLRDIEIHAL